MPGHTLTEKIAERLQAGADYLRQLNEVINQRTAKWQKLIIIRGTLTMRESHRSQATHCKRHTNTKPVQMQWSTTKAVALEKWVCSI